MSARNKNIICARSSRSASINRLALMIIIVLIGPAHYDCSANAERQVSEPREFALEAEQRLAELGYWTGPADGVFDSASRHALIAFQKVERRSLTGKLVRIDHSS